ncbi:MAG: hypothetical protein VX899_24870 [Myxococcota bacterium]|nr:hypothetical protein [Myxococcota bacterium]
MSLTSRADSPSGRAVFKQWMRKPECRPGEPLRVPSCGGSPALMGTAFDYAMRAGFEVLWPERCESGPLIAERAPLAQRSREQARACEALLERALQDLQTWEDAEALTRAQARACWDLALLEPIGRGVASVAPDTWIGREPPPGWLEELQALYAEITWDAFVPAERCLLNPGFGEGSLIVGGADADLVLDDLLIDIKTTKDLRLRLKDVRQLVGYAILARAYGFNGGPPEPIERVGIYYSRSGELVVWELDDCVDAEGESAVLEELVRAR